MRQPYRPNCMKRIVYALIFLVSVLLSGCKNDLASAGHDVLPEDDAIFVYLDTFHITSQLDSCGSLISTPDSFLVGELETGYGVLRAEVLTQLAAPLGFRYPEGSEVDSILLFLHYNTQTGDTLSPLALQIYLMDKATLSYDGVYMSDIDVSDYCSMGSNTQITTHPQLVVASQDSIYALRNEEISAVVFRMNDTFTQEFFAIQDFDDQEAFNAQFKGLYITSEFGSSTVLHLTDIWMNVYYHFPYTRYNPVTNTTDTLIEKDIKGFYSNAEVKQVNRFEYMNGTSLLDSLQQYTDKLNYIVSPAGVYTQLNFPVREMVQTIISEIGEENKRNAYVNMARLRIPIIYDPNKPEQLKTPEDWMQPASNMALIWDSIREEIFLDKTLLLTTSKAEQSNLKMGLTEDEQTEYYYEFDVSDLLMEKIGAYRDNSSIFEGADSVMVMTLVPITVEQTTSSSGVTTTTAIKQLQTISSTVIPSPTNPDTPLIIEVVSSGF